MAATAHGWCGRWGRQASRTPPSAVVLPARSAGRQVSRRATRRLFAAGINCQARSTRTAVTQPSLRIRGRFCRSGSPVRFRGPRGDGLASRAVRPADARRTLPQRGTDGRLRRSRAGRRRADVRQTPLRRPNGLQPNRRAPVAQQPSRRRTDKRRLDDRQTKPERAANERCSSDRQTTLERAANERRLDDEGQANNGRESHSQAGEDKQTTDARRNDGRNRQPRMATDASRRFAAMLFRPGRFVSCRLDAGRTSSRNRDGGFRRVAAGRCPEPSFGDRLRAIAHDGDFDRSPACF